MSTPSPGTTLRPRIVAPLGSPLHAALVGTEDLQRSVGFYCGQLGMQEIADYTTRDPEFARHWHLSTGTSVRVVVLADREADVGRIVLHDFGKARQPRIRTLPDQRFVGLVNLNFYTNDIHGHTNRLAALGYEPWTEPVQHLMDPTVGAPTEVMIDGPDGVIINLVELTTGGPDTRIGHMRAYVEGEFGYNRAGFTPVVTSQHCVDDIHAAIAFYERVLGMGVLIDDVLHREALNRFMRYAEGALTRCVFMQGGHMFGKVALNQPLNQHFPNAAQQATPMSVGYFAQSFLVKDLDAALHGARQAGAELYSEPLYLEVPGVGLTRAAVLRNPGSGALQQIVERLN
jgi:catechol 2,3-dioxygenase-like lactoylglutathione lyase family enzyme